MTTKQEFSQLASLCIAQAHGASNRRVAEALLSMADEYRRQAAALEDGKVPERDEGCGGRAADPRRGIIKLV